MIFHICEQKEWAKAEKEGVYRPPSLDKEGFIHLSTYGQLISTANRLFINAENPIVPVVENNLLSKKELKWEGLDGMEFPHIYRPLHPDEVHTTLSMTRRGREFVTSKELERWGKSLNLETDRLLLREFLLSDFEAVHSYASDSAIPDHMVWGPNSPVDTRQFLSRVFKWQSTEPRDEFHLAVVEKETGRLIGACNISIEDMDQTTGSIGYIIRGDRQKQGFATELSRKLLDFGFQILKLERIEATCDENNAASLKVMKKIGMRQENLIENDHIAGKIRNTIVCATSRNKAFVN